MQYKLDEVMAHDALLLGRVTYEGFAQAWPGRSDEIGFADKMNSMEKYVVSSTLGRAEWNNTTVVSGELPVEITRVKEGRGGDVLVAGSSQLVQALLANGFVDELRLMVFPIVLGSGKRLFAHNADPVSLELLSAKQLPSGTRSLPIAPRATNRTRESLSRPSPRGVSGRGRARSKVRWSPDERTLLRF
jgi:dihydrofolate reductase